MEKTYLYDLEENTIVEIQSSYLENYKAKTQIVGEYTFIIKELILREIMHKIKVVGKSMVPFLLPGECISITNDVDKLNVGDVVVFVKSDSLIVHRVKIIKDGLIVTKGDNCLFDDSQIAVDDIVGIVVKRHINFFVRILYFFKYLKKRKYKISKNILTTIFKPVRSTCK